MRTKISTASTVDPILLTEATDHLRITNTDDATYIGAVIKAVAATIEAETGRALLTQTIIGYLDAFPSDDFIELPFPPLQSVTSIAYIDTDGVSQTLSSANYSTDLSGVLGRILLNYNESWPSTRSQHNAVTITFVAGYTSATVPHPIKAAAKLLVSHLYENREAVNVGGAVNEIPKTVEYLLAQYRVVTAG